MCTDQARSPNARWLAALRVGLRLAELASHGDLTTAARFFGLAEKTAEGWYYEYLQRRQRQQRESSSSQPSSSCFQPVQSLGIDELSLKKDTGNSAAC